MLSSNPLDRAWGSVAPYVVPPVAGAVAIVPAYFDMAGKTALQLGKSAPRLTFSNFFQALKGGAGAAPVVGNIVGTQMALLKGAEEALQWTFPAVFDVTSDSGKGRLLVVSSVAVGAISSPFLAVYNGKTMTPPWTYRQSLAKFTLKQAGAITLQEGGFVGGLAAAGFLSEVVKPYLGDSRSVTYSAAAAAGGIGSLLGHAGNTALTLWQNGMQVERARMLTRGSWTRARGTALFAVVFKGVKEAIIPPETVNE